jgi:hypothetical protein
MKEGLLFLLCRIFPFCHEEDEEEEAWRDDEEGGEPDWGEWQGE